MVKNIFSLLQTADLGRVFINYRRTDTQWVAGRLADALGHYFGDDRVFRDIEGIRGGADFAEVIHSTLGTADAVIVLIGEHWLDTSDGTGPRRLDDPDDWVAQEIAAALDAGVPIYPVLVDDAVQHPAAMCTRRSADRDHSAAQSVSHPRYAVYPRSTGVPDR